MILHDSDDTGLCRYNLIKYHLEQSQDGKAFKKNFDFGIKLCYTVNYNNTTITGNHFF